MILGNPSVVVKKKNMFRIAPKTFNAVNMILAPIGKGLAVVQLVVLAPALQGIVSSESVCIVHRFLSGMLPDMGH